MKLLVTASDNCGSPTVTVTHVDGGTPCAKTRTFTITATDGCGNAVVTPSTVVDTWTDDTTPPMITCPSDAQLQCGDSTEPNDTGAATATDDCDSSPTVTYSDSTVGACPPLTTITRTWKATDACGNSVTCEQTIILSPVAPNDTQCPVTTNPIANPNPVAISNAVVITATVSDTDTGGSTIASAEYSIDGGAWLPMSASDGAFDEITEGVTATNTFTAAGVYNICIRGADSAGNNNCSSNCDLLIAVYDPSAGFVTGGGWLNSPAGAYKDDLAATGKANFGFVSKYQKGKTVPTGDTEFQFKAGNLNFKSGTYEWLVVSGAMAQYKGAGTINGVPGYSFLLTATDGQISGGGGYDKLRMKIWNTTTSVIVYDNILSPDGDKIISSNTQLINGGSIVIHK
jgi:hypothetical protein